MTKLTVDLTYEEEKLIDLVKFTMNKKSKSEAMKEVLKILKNDIHKLMDIYWSDILNNPQKIKKI